MTEFKYEGSEVEKGRNKFIDFVKANPKTVAVVIAALAVVAFIAILS